jgi:hypothetical protein
MEGLEPVRWPWWRVIRANDQNITADIELARVELSNLEHCQRSTEEQAILRVCIQMFTQCKESQRRIFSNRIFVRQTLFLILQNIILIAPTQNLQAIWITIKQRLETIEASDAAEYKRSNTIRQIDEYIKQLARSKGVKLTGDESRLKEKNIREILKQIKSFLDEKVVTELWSAIVLQRQTYVLGLVALLALVGTLASICLENCELSALFSCTFKRPTHGALPATMAGILGGALSTILTPITSSGSSIPLVRVAFIRPLVGGAAGLFLFLVSGYADALKFGYPHLYAAAIAIGFSERLFANALGSTANQIAAGVSRALGHRKSPAR